MSMAMAMAMSSGATATARQCRSGARQAVAVVVGTAGVVVQVLRGLRRGFFLVDHDCSSSASQRQVLGADKGRTW